MAKNRRQLIISAILLIIALGFGVSIGAIAWIIQDTPDITNYKGTSEATFIYSADGQLITKLFQENRIYVPLDRIPKELQTAIVAIEDTNFYVHHGIDFWGIARAFVTNIMKGRLDQGASTITQQLARNALGLTFKKTFYRKIQEAYLAVQFERLYTKPEILEMYLNEIFLGDLNHNAYGVEAASRLYFDKHVWELNLSESALIAALPKGSNLYSPLRNYEGAVNRRNVVLNRMFELGYISEEDHIKAKNMELKIKSASPEREVTAPYFIRHIRDELIDRFGAQMVYSGGLKIYTTLDLEMQNKAEAAVENAIKTGYIPTVERTNSADKQQPQLALITIDPENGAIRAMVGGRGNDQFNRTIQAVRQPGSAFKPFVYTTAINQGYSPGNVVNDMPMLAQAEEDQPMRIWPKNFGDEYRGHVTLRTALNHSINVAAVKLIQEVGVTNTIKTAESMGITTFQTSDREESHLSLALGGLTRGVTPLEMASAYGVLANNGIRVEPISITKVLDNRDRVIYQAHPEKRVVLSEDVTYIMTNMLRSVITRGTGWRANLNRPVAGKTGTTNNYSDAWFVGFTPDLVTSVWIGEDNLRSMVYEEKDEDGNYLFSENGQPLTISSGEAVRLWGDYMRDVVKDRPVKYFSVPENIVEVEIDPVTGLLPNRYTPVTQKEIFRKANTPEEVENLHQSLVTVKVDRETNLLATDSCPEDQVVEYKYFADSGIRVGPAEISFGKKSEESEENEENEEEESEEGIKGTYLVGKGEPVQLINPETGVPQMQNGQPLYETIPLDKCDLHQPKEQKLIDSIWNLFNF